MLKKYESERQKVQYVKRIRQQQQESDAIKDLKERVTQLENEKQILQESMNELISEEDFNFFEDERYNDEIMTVYYDLLSKNVSIENCRHVVRSVLEMFTKRKVGRLPKKSVAARMKVEAKCMSKIQACEAMVKGNRNVLHTDGTKLRFEELASWQVTTEEGSYTLGF